MAGDAKRTKLEEMLDEKRQECASLSPQRDTGRVRQLEREIEYLEGMRSRRQPGIFRRPGAQVAHGPRNSRRRGLLRRLTAPRPASRASPAGLERSARGRRRHRTAPDL